MNLTAVLVPEEGGYVSRCIELDVTSQGDTFEEAVANLKEAVELYLEEFPERRPRGAAPIVTRIEVGADAA